MKIETAIEILRSAIAYQDWPELTELNQAQQLGIEALQWINQWRGVNSPLSNLRLPSETKE